MKGITLGLSLVKYHNPLVVEFELEPETQVSCRLQCKLACLNTKPTSAAINLSQCNRKSLPSPQLRSEDSNSLAAVPKP